MRKGAFLGAILCALIAGMLIFVSLDMPREYFLFYIASIVGWVLTAALLVEISIDPK